MIRLVLLLCGGLYVTAMVLGADHGQKRYGLMLADSQPAAVVQPDGAGQKTVFVPAQPVMRAAAVTPEPVVAPETGPVQTATAQTDPAQLAPVQPALQTVALNTTPDALPSPQIQGGLLYTVAAVQANVRGGPGRTFAVLDSLKRGEQVLLILEAQPLEGWSRVRIEGDGVEGYVSTKLLTPSRNAGFPQADHC